MFKLSTDFQIVKVWKNAEGKTVKHCKKGQHELIITFANEPSPKAIKQFNLLWNKQAWQYAS